jgi:hypothetical protein
LNLRRLNAATARRSCPGNAGKDDNSTESDATMFCHVTGKPRPLTDLDKGELTRAAAIAAAVAGAAGNMRGSKG